MHLVDGRTRAKLEAASGVEEINAILNHRDTVWQVRAPCLRHPDTVGGCTLPVGVDLDSFLNLDSFVVLYTLNYQETDPEGVC